MGLGEINVSRVRIENYIASQTLTKAAYCSAMIKKRRRNKLPVKYYNSSIQSKVQNRKLRVLLIFYTFYVCRNYYIVGIYIYIKQLQYVGNVYKHEDRTILSLSERQG